MGTDEIRTADHDNNPNQTAVPAVRSSSANQQGSQQHSRFAGASQMHYVKTTVKQPTTTFVLRSSEKPANLKKQ